MSASTDDIPATTDAYEITTSSNAAYGATDIPTSSNQAYGAAQHQSGSDTEVYSMPASTDGEHGISTSTYTAYEITTYADSACVITDVPTSINEACKATQGPSDGNTLTYYYTCYDATAI